MLEVIRHNCIRIYVLHPHNPYTTVLKRMQKHVLFIPLFECLTKEFHIPISKSDKGLTTILLLVSSFYLFLY